MTKTNRFGLEREIDADSKRIIRQQSYFSCVICGNLIYEYHHIEEYAGIIKHDPNQIVLLCANCHSDVTGSPENRRISNATLQKFIDSPYGARYGEGMWKNLTHIEGIKIGSFLFVETRIALRIEGTDILSFCIVNDDFPIIGINAKIFDKDGVEILEIEENTVHGNTEAWDMTFKSNILQINHKARGINLRIIFHNNGIIEITHMNLYHNSCRVRILRDGSLECKTEAEVIIKAQEARIMGASVGIEVKNGFMSFGKAERETYGRGVSKHTNLRPRRFSRGGGKSITLGGMMDNWVTDQAPRTASVDFEGQINGANVSFKNNYFGPGITPMKVDKNSISIGVVESEI